MKTQLLNQPDAETFCYVRAVPPPKLEKFNVSTLGSGLSQMTYLCKYNFSWWISSSSLKQTCAITLAFLHFYHCQEKAMSWSTYLFQQNERQVEQNHVVMTHSSHCSLPQEPHLFLIQNSKSSTWNPKQDPLNGGQGETEDRGQSLQIHRWQF